MSESTSTPTIHGVIIEDGEEEKEAKIGVDALFAEGVTDGSFLRVINGQPVWTLIESAEEVGF